MELSTEQQILELSHEFFDEARAVIANRSPIERQMALRHVDFILDSYNDLTRQDDDGKSAE